jgi:single-stranded DNA-binding protein
MAADWPSVNRITVIGRVGRVKEYQFDDGSIAFHVAVATKRLAPSKTGLVTVLDWHNVVIPGLKRVKQIREKLYKGTILYVEGRVRTHVYDKGKETRRIYQDITCDFYQVITEGQEQLKVEVIDQKLHDATRSTVEGSFQRFDDFQEGKQ